VTLSTRDILRLPPSPAKDAMLRQLRQARATPTDDANPAPSPKRMGGRGVRREPGEMNKTEQAYATHLESRKFAGEVLWYEFEAWKFRLADKTFLTVDFIVMLANGELEAHDVKGAKKKANGEPGYWCEDDAKVKLKCAAEKHPIRFCIAFRSAKGWEIEVL
jgi:hypothetical protein